MSELRFEWDERKNRENQRKHGVSFEEAQTVFFVSARSSSTTTGIPNGNTAFFCLA
jgi:uncharacterized DUF497 family protein